MTRLVGLLVLLLAVMAVGCAKETTSTPVQEPGPTDQIKTELQSVADAGELSSGLVTVREQLEKMKATDAAKADALLQELDALEKMSDPAQIKAKAQEMIGKL